MNRLAYRFIAAKRERHVGYAAGNLGKRQGALDLAGGLDEIDGVVVMLFDAGCHRENIGVEDDVFGREI
ncbi:hypothetical protein GALL_525180 [mine drainage metagenome]|uniref:Uncharacterized protein n=1 Tax=mine drainage metagenome TaxID=410659 RepID=A0A1J5P417_9ZZZZ